MPPFHRPQTHRHNQNDTLPYDRPASSSSSTSTKTKGKLSPRPDSPIALKKEVSDVARALDKKKKRKKRTRGREQEKRTSASNVDILDGSQSNSHAPNPTTMASLEDKDAILKRYMALSAPRPSGDSRSTLTPSKNKAESSPIQRSNWQPVPPPVKKDDGQVWMLQKQLARANQGAERIAAEMRDKIEGLEREIETHKTQLAEQDKFLEEGTKMKEALKEAVGCGVCFETLRDPHILSCGHIACKECLVTWFRTAGAYLHEIHEPVTPHLNTSYRSKVCHVCRTTITRRPARVYHLRAILEPLGIDSVLPTASQEDLQRDDPWRYTFPVEKTSYRLHDENDGVFRCPECCGEIEEGMCVGCAIEFSDTESDGDEGDWESEDGSLGSILDEMLDENDVFSDLEASDEETRNRVTRAVQAIARGHRRGRLNRPARPVRPLPARANQPGPRQLLDDTANESDELGGENDYPDVEGSDLDDSDDYGGSIIDDGELSGEQDGEGNGEGEGDEDGGLDEMEVDVDVGQSEKEEGESEEDDPPIEELRRRRVQRHGPIAAGPLVEGRDSPEVRRGRRGRRRAMVNLNSDEE